ncbi:MAG: hypothetical protein H6557_06955 [Lewinellaceae bacterium]|nr:hypothetical protein [Phaeodactylibacter sp.]MCB9036341.1 hypothetical protein [Lewinellaceae bacterium]
MKNNLALNTIALAFFLSLGACDYKKLPEPEPPEFCDTADVTYNNQIKAIVDNSCAYSGCHDGAGGIGPFDYTNYDGLSNAFGVMRTRVVNLRDDPAQGMPPNRSVYPQSQKDNLTQQELELFECWINAGFPEE